MARGERRVLAPRALPRVRPACRPSRCAAGGRTSPTPRTHPHANRPPAPSGAASQPSSRDIPDFPAGGRHRPARRRHGGPSAALERRDLPPRGDRDRRARRPAQDDPELSCRPRPQGAITGGVSVNDITRAARRSGPRRRLAEPGVYAPPGPPRVARSRCSSAPARSSSIRRAARRVAGSCRRARRPPASKASPGGQRRHSRICAARRPRPRRRPATGRCAPAPGLVPQPPDTRFDLAAGGGKGLRPRRVALRCAWNGGRRGWSSMRARGMTARASSRCAPGSPASAVGGRACSAGAPARRLEERGRAHRRPARQRAAPRHLRVRRRGSCR